MRSIIIAIAIVSVIAAAAVAGVSAHPTAATPEQGCCFADGTTPFSYVLNATSFNAVSPSADATINGRSTGMPVFSSQYTQADPAINKTYWERRAYHQDGTWSSMQQWYWYDAAQSVWMLADKRSDQTPSCKVGVSAFKRPDFLFQQCTGGDGYELFVGSVGVGNQQMYRYEATNTFPALMVRTTIVDASNCAPVSRVTNSPSPITSSTGTFTDVRPTVNAALFQLPSDCRRAAIMSPLRGDAATKMVTAAIEAKRAVV